MNGTRMGRATYNTVQRMQHVKAVRVSQLVPVGHGRFPLPGHEAPVRALVPCFLIFFICYLLCLLICDTEIASCT